MDIEQFKKRIHPDFTPLSSRQTWAWYVLIFIPFLVFSVSAGIALWNYFTNTDIKSIGVSNVGFAMFTGLASVCFSYYKILEAAKYKQLHLDLQKSGEFFLMAALAFITSSALKYSWSVTQNESFSVIEWLLRLFCKITFGTAELTCILGMARLIDVLHIRMNMKKPPVEEPEQDSKRY